MAPPQGKAGAVGKEVVFPVVPMETRRDFSFQHYNLWEQCRSHTLNALSFGYLDLVVRYTCVNNSGHVFKQNTASRLCSSSIAIRVFDGSPCIRSLRYLFRLPGSSFGFCPKCVFEMR